MPVPAQAGSRGIRRSSAWRFFLAWLSAALCLLAYVSCNRDFSNPVDGPGNGSVDTAGTGLDSGAGQDTVAKPAKPDSLAAKDLTLTAGDDAVAPSLAWYPADFPDKRYQMISDNAAVAKVEGAKIRPLAAGSAQITVITEAGRLVVRFEATVKAKPKPPGQADSVIHVISVSAASISLYVGEEVQPQLTWNPSGATDKTFTLSTQDDDKVEIHGSRITAKAAGTAHVLVSARDGGKTATFTLTIAERDTRVRVQSLSAADMSLAIGQEAGPDLTWMPSDATVKTYLLTSADPDVVAVAGTRLRAVGAGSAIVLVQSLDDATKTAAFKVTVAVRAQSVSVQDMTLRAGGPDVEPTIVWTPPDATDKGYILSAATSHDSRPAAAVVGNKVRPLRAGTLAFTVTPTGGAAPATFLVTVQSRLQSISAADTLIEEDARDVAPRLSWDPPDIEDKSYSLSASGAAVQVNGTVFGAAAIGEARITVTATEGNRQATFKVTVVQKGCVEAMDRREPGPDGKDQRKCCRETGRLCPIVDPPPQVPPPPADTAPPVVVTPPADTTPPVVVTPPADTTPPVVVTPPADTVPPVVVTPPADTAPPVVTPPPGDTLQAG